MSGRKDDDGKIRYELLPAEALKGWARVLTFGATKYAPRNWELGIAYGRVFGALLRHLWAWWAREATDPETGYSHLAHAQCCLGFLATYEARGMVEWDDRPWVTAAQRELNMGPDASTEDDHSARARFVSPRLPCTLDTPDQTPLSRRS